MRPDILLCVPMKDPCRAKTRLRDSLDPAERARFARAMFDRTLDLLIRLRREDAQPLFDLAVVTGCETIHARAEALGVRAIAERPDATLTDAATDAAQAAADLGYDKLCLLPADLAAPAPEEIRQLLMQELPTPGLVLCPSRDFGTNAVLAAPPTALPFAFGPGSFHAHRSNAEAAGLTPILLPLESLRWDIDSSADLAAFRSLAPSLFDGETA